MNLPFKMTRHAFVLALFLCLVLVWIGRILYVQTNPRLQEKIRSEAERMSISTISTKEARGTITDRHGIELARSYMVGAIVVDSVLLNEGNAKLFLSQNGNRRCSANRDLTAVKPECEAQFNRFLLDELKELLAYLDPSKSPEVLLRELRERKTFLAFPRAVVEAHEGRLPPREEAINPADIITDADRPRKPLLDAKGKPQRDAAGQPLWEDLPLPPGKYLHSELVFLPVPSQYWRIKEDIPLTELEEVLGNKNYRGFSQDNYYLRSYPDPEVMGNIIGYVRANVDGVEGQGEAGAEFNFNAALLGRDGKQKIIRTKDNKVLYYLDEITPAQRAADLVLSVDSRLQHIVYDVLQEAMKEFRAEAALATVVDVKSGEILAMVSLPTVDISNPDERSHFRDKNYMDKYEPGSVIKPIVIAAALDAKVISPNSTFSTNQVYTLGKNVVRDVGNYGTLDIRGILKKSSNIGMAKISERFPRGKFYGYMRAFGFGEPALNFRAEANAHLHNPEKRDPNAPKRLFYNAFAYANMHYGYAIEATAVQLASAYATLGNDGIRMPLTLLKRTGPVSGTRVVSQSVARQVQDMLQAVVAGEGGTGHKAMTEEYSVEGKTGTSHKVVSGRKGYSDKKYLSLFAGLVPSHNPKLAIVIIIDSPDKSKGHFGGVVAAPLFSKITSRAMKVLGIAPDKIEPVDALNQVLAPPPDSATIAPASPSTE